MKQQSLGRVILLAAIGILGSGLVASAQVIDNGTFENWGTLTGSPPAGVPSNWSFTGTVSPVQTAGLVSGSNYAALIQPGGQIYQTISPNPTNLKLDMTFAATNPGLTSSRSFNITIGEPGANPSLNFRMVAGSVAGMLTLQVHNGSAWSTLAANAFQSSVYDSASNTFTTLNAYDLSIELSYGTTSSYSISYGLHGGTMTLLSNLTTFTAANANGMSTIGIVGSSSASPFAVDNLTLTVVPEPGRTAYLMWSGAVLMSISYWGRRTSAARVVSTRL